MANSKALPQTYLLITIAVMVVLHLSFPLKRLASYPANLLGCIPLLAGMALILVGLALLMGSLSPFLAVVVFAVLMDLIFVHVEEQMLEKEFGESWLDYKQRVRRWI